MTKQQRAMSAVILLSTASMVSPAVAQTATSSAKAAPHRRKAAAHHREHTETASERATREKLETLQSQIDALKQQVADKDTALATAQQSADQASQQAAQALQASQAANASLTANQQTTVELQDKIASVQQANTDLATTITDTQRNLNERIESPAALHYKGVTITPGGYFAMEGVWRQRSVNSDINTPFNSIPFPGSSEGHVGELNFSGRQSRLSVLVQGQTPRYKLSGYFEGDFLSAGVTSNNNQSNSYTLRQRQFWAQAANTTGLTVTGGQMWSLATEDGRGTDNRTEKLPEAIDAQYVVGFTWARQPSLRVQQRWGDYKTGAFTAAMSLEQAQITNFTATSATAGAVPTNFFFSGAGQGGGLYNAFNGTYANNVAPDVVVKGAFDTAHAHVEIGGIARFLRDNYYPILGTSTTNGTTTYKLSKTQTSDTKAAGGVFGAVRVSPSHYFDVGLSLMAGQGVGRYGSSQLADATIHPDGTLEPIRNYHGLFSLQTHPTKKLDVFAYYGGEYAQRTVYTSTTGAFAGALMGYGAPNLSNTGCYALPANPGSATGGSPSTSGCSAPTRYIQEGMAGFTYKIINDPKYGRLQYSLNYQYLQRNLWSGVGNAVTPAGPRALDNMVFGSLRYYIP